MFMNFKTFPVAHAEVVLCEICSNMFSDSHTINIGCFIPYHHSYAPSNTTPRFDIFAPTSSLFISIDIRLLYSAVAMVAKHWQWVMASKRFCISPSWWDRQTLALAILLLSYRNRTFLTVVFQLLISMMAAKNEGRWHCFC